MLLAGTGRPVAVLDRNSTCWGQEILEIPICGDDNFLPQLIKEGVAAFVVGLGGNSNNLARRRLFEIGMEMRLSPLLVIHPKSICSKYAKVGLGTVLLAGSIVNVRAKLGMNVIVNTGSIIEHDCIIGDHVHVATGARISGSVTINDEAHIGAGAVVVKDVEPGVVVTGVPACPTSPKVDA